LVAFLVLCARPHAQPRRASVSRMLCHHPVRLDVGAYPDGAGLRPAREAALTRAAISNPPRPGISRLGGRREKRPPILSGLSRHSTEGRSRRDGRARPSMARQAIARPDAISRGIGREIIARFIPAGACGIASVGTGRVACSEGSASSSPGRRAFGLLRAGLVLSSPVHRRPVGRPQRLTSSVNLRERVVQQYGRGAGYRALAATDCR
jgi:hypothetical protein